MQIFSLASFAWCNSLFPIAFHDDTFWPTEDSFVLTEERSVAAIGPRQARRCLFELALFVAAQRVEWTAFGAFLQQTLGTAHLFQAFVALLALLHNHIATRRPIWNITNTIN